MTLTKRATTKLGRFARIIESELKTLTEGNQRTLARVMSVCVDYFDDCNMIVAHSTF
jgi:hypothetical protein